MKHSFNQVILRLQWVLTAICGSSLILFWIFKQEWLALVSVGAGSIFAFKAAFTSIKDRLIDVNVLMVLAAVGAVLLGHYSEAAVLLFLFSLSSTLEEFALGKTTSAIEGLVKLRPRTATVQLDDGKHQEIPLEQIRVGDLVVVSSFQQIPADAQIIEGVTHVDQSSMTGESRPIAEEVNDDILAGTQNLEGAFVARVTAEPGHSLIDKVIELVRDAQENRASGEKISAWFGQWYTIFVLLAFALSVVWRWNMSKDLNEALQDSLVLLVALSPCALVISVPASTLSALAWAGRHGILIRGGEQIELASSITEIYMDKTGTLTKGKPELAEILVYSKENSETVISVFPQLDVHSREMLKLAACAESLSDHPIAVAIVNAALQSGLNVEKLTQSKVIPGMGISASCEGKMLSIGQIKFFDELPEDFHRKADEMRERQMTVAVMEYGDYYVALGLKDQTRQESKEVIRLLKTMGVKSITMLTGDSNQTAQAVAEEVHVDRFEGELLPQDKEAIIRQSVELGEKAMMVGDGVNDAPSLSRATLGVAMGGLGSDVALAAADVVLMKDNLHAIPQLIQLGKRTRGVILFNLVFASGIILILTLGSLLSAYLPEEVRSHLLSYAVVGHEGSTLIVIANGLRLLGGVHRRDA